jgi:transporter family protein
MNVKALLIGGLLPTVLLGLSTVLMKLSMREGSSVPNYLVHVALMGLAWTGAIGAMAYAVSSLGVPVSIIAPLTNSNALVALAVSALVFREWADLSGPRVAPPASRFRPRSFPSFCGR